VEHPAILEVVRALEREGTIDLTIVGVDRCGVVDPGAIADAIRPETVLVTLMLANNEVGTLQPVQEVAAHCRRRGVFIHTDAAQAVGKVSVDVEDLGVDLLSVAGHKLYAPKGVGALFVRQGVSLEPQIRGAGHEGGLRAGTENVLGVVGLGRALELVRDEGPSEHEWMEDLRNRLVEKLRRGFSGLVVHGDPARCLPNTASVAFPGVDSSRVLSRLSDRVAASAGAACHADGVDVSHVLAAMGVDSATALASVRLSIGRFTTDDEVVRGADLILEAVHG
jgi:cysteine desulfurase